MGNWGCLLPLLIVFNLFFGRLIFNSVGLWLGVEAVLVLIFMLKIKLMFSRIIQSHEPQGRGLASARQSHEPQGRKPGRVVDVEGKVVGEENKLK